MSEFKNILESLSEDEFDLSKIEQDSDATQNDEFDLSQIDSEDKLDTSNIHQSTRLLGIDKKKINTELKSISETPKQTSIPLSKIKEVFSKWGIQTVFDGVTFTGKHGNKDFNLIKGGKLIKNAKLIIYWNKAEYLTLNIYVS